MNRYSFQHPCLNCTLSLAIYIFLWSSCMFWCIQPTKEPINCHGPCVCNLLRRENEEPDASRHGPKGTDAINTYVTIPSHLHCGNLSQQQQVYKAVKAGSFFTMPRQKIRHRAFYVTSNWKLFDGSFVEGNVSPLVYTSYIYTYTCSVAHLDMNWCIHEQSDPESQ